VIQIRGSLRGARPPETRKISGTEVGRNKLDRGDLLKKKASGNTLSVGSFSGGDEAVWERVYGDELVAVVPLRIQL
jgi:hypothetical protein